MVNKCEQGESSQNPLGSWTWSLIEGFLCSVSEIFAIPLPLHIAREMMFFLCAIALSNHQIDVVGSQMRT